MRGHELGSLHPAEQFVRVAAHVPGDDFISHDASFGVDDETAPLGHAFRFDHHVEIPGQRSGGIGEHGILDFLYGLRGIVPRLVDEMAVARNRIDLASDGFEIFIFFSEILKLRGAHEREVGRVEEEHAPLAQHFSLGDGTESVVLVALYGEIGNFFLNQGHGWFNLHSYFLRLAITNHKKIIRGFRLLVKRECRCL
mgnify:CR=1 FL=1